MPEIMETYQEVGKFKVKILEYLKKYALNKMVLNYNEHNFLS